MSREVAVAVIDLALRDATDPRLSAVKRTEARQWFASPAAAWWCAVAGLDPSAVRHALRKRLE
jgi:hypothetical protein